MDLNDGGEKIGANTDHPTAEIVTPSQMKNMVCLAAGLNQKKELRRAKTISKKALTTSAEKRLESTVMKIIFRCAVLSLLSIFS